MLQIIKSGTKYDFVGQARLFGGISLFACIASLAIILATGLNLGLDFAGGHQILLRFEKPIPAEAVRTTLSQLFPKVDTSVQSFEVPTEADKTFFLTRIERSEVLSIDAGVVEAMKQLDPAVTAPNVEFVGPAVGKQLRNDGILAVFYALLCILIYVALRFDFYYSPGAVICLLHDALITVGILTAIGAEFSLVTIAGILTLVGYSINDTIVIFDRVREIIGKARGTAMKQVLNRSLNETLGRTLVTSGTVLLSCICLVLFGRGTALYDFGLLMAIGCIIGVYSTVYVASPIFMFLRNRFGPKEIAMERGG